MHVRLLPSDGVHHTDHVLDALLQGWHAVKTVRQTDAALVEHHARHELSQAFQGTPKQLMPPANLDVRDELRHDQTRWPDAPFVVGDAQTATTLA